MAQTAAPTNGFDGNLLNSYLDRIDNVEEEIASIMGKAMAEAKSLRGDIKEIYGEAKDKGIPVKALKTEHRLRSLDRQKSEIVEGLDDEDRDSLEAIQAALGDFASLPLGGAALARAGG